MVTKQDIETLIRDLENLGKTTGINIDPFIDEGFIPIIKEEYGAKKWIELNPKQEVCHDMNEAYKIVKSKYDKLLRVIEDINKETPKFLN